MHQEIDLCKIPEALKSVVHKHFDESRYYSALYEARRAGAFSLAIYLVSAGKDGDSARAEAIEIIDDHWPQLKTLFLREYAAAPCRFWLDRIILESKIMSRDSDLVSFLIDNLRSAYDMGILKYCTEWNNPSLRKLFFVCFETDILERSDPEGRNDVRAMRQNLYNTYEEIFECATDMIFFNIIKLDFALFLSSWWKDVVSIDKLRGNLKVVGCSEFQERCAITKALSELPGDRWDSRDFWDNLGPDGQAAWRQELLQSVHDSEQLRRGLVEACCWWANKDAFAELQPVLKKCFRDAKDFNFLDSLVSHPSRTVQLRSRGLLQLISSGSLAPLIANASSPIPETDTPSRTWMGNPKVESFLYRCVRSVEIETATDIKSNFSQDEEALTANFLASLQKTISCGMGEFRNQMRYSRGQSPSISIQVRQPSKVEEGRPGPSGLPLGVDIFFIVKVIERRRLITERATYVQVKKIQKGKKQKLSKFLDIDLKQCDDIISHTESAFYLFMVPPWERAEQWVVPARLVRNLMSLNDSKSRLPDILAHDSSQNFSDFFLNGLIGLWVGDESSEICQKAKGDADLGLAGRFIVEIRVSRDPNGEVHIRPKI